MVHSRALPPGDDRENLLATVATLYYELSQSQQQIADRLEVSRTSVSRLLAEARERGIVRVQILRTLPRDFVVEQELIAQFGLRDAYVLQMPRGADFGAHLAQAGRLAASYLRQVIPALPLGCAVGVAWGTSVEATVDALPDGVGQGIDVVQLVGGVGALAVDGADLARMVAAKLGVAILTCMPRPWSQTR